jgi:1-deoxy-D-xylulose-5-phosphate synthase
MVVSAPMNEAELRNLMYTAQLDKNAVPFSIRYPRGQGVMPEWKTPFEEIKIGTARKIREGKDIAILTIGHPGNFAVEATELLKKSGVNAAHYDMRFVKPIDEAMLHEVFAKFDKVITVEDGCIQGGFGSAVLEFMADHNYKAEIKRLGIPDKWVEHGEQPELWNECGFDVSAIVDTAKEMVLYRVMSNTNL